MTGGFPHDDGRLRSDVLPRVYPPRLPRLLVPCPAVLCVTASCACKMRVRVPLHTLVACCMRHVPFRCPQWSSAWPRRRACARPIIAPPQPRSPAANYMLTGPLERHISVFRSSSGTRGRAAPPEVSAEARWARVVGCDLVPPVRELSQSQNTVTERCRSPVCARNVGRGDRRGGCSILTDRKSVV